MADATIIDTDRAHSAAVFELLQQNMMPGSVYGYYLDEVTGSDDDPIKYPYLVVWTGPSLRSSPTLGPFSQVFEAVVHVTAAGRDPEEAYAARSRAVAALIDRRPVVAGRKCSPLRQEDIQVPAATPPGEHDPATSRPVFACYAQFRIYSTPA